MIATKLFRRMAANTSAAFAMSPVKSTSWTIMFLSTWRISLMSFQTFLFKMNHWFLKLLWFCDWLWLATPFHFLKAVTFDCIQSSFTLKILKIWIWEANVICLEVLPWFTRKIRLPKSIRHYSSKRLLRILTTLIPKAELKPNVLNTPD